MATTTKKTSKVKNAPTKTKSRSGGSDSVAVVIAKPSNGRGNGSHVSLYEEALKEIVSLSENDAQAKRVDNGPLSEARGKDIWHLHTELQALDRANRNFEQVTGSLQNATLSAIQQAESAITTAVSKTQSAVNRGVTDGVTDLQGRVDALLKTVKDSFSKLAQATAGTEENLKSQTNAFSKATESLLNTVQSELDKRIREFRDEITRQVDKRFNQADVAFAAVRADQEVLKALLTDIIKDRLGRAEPRVK